ncbi:MAG: hypothetical protein KAG91_01180 [Mycoplasmataceae bacterium]|nr:hypothetical protein [Mycoplasmataceae bacterium]
MNILVIIFVAIMIPVCVIVFGLAVWKSYSNSKSLKQNSVEEEKIDE